MHVRRDAPQQCVLDDSGVAVDYDKRAGTDCGLFAVLFAMYATLGLEMDFSQADMPVLRSAFADIVWGCETGNYEDSGE
eukprot:CAMPEP_0180306990 /NCGR_PEP_ID=MMETSP0988-20121125/27449_1 /TAXON_ID=697907 /ORGANISM="non described non described, Strain CCMP2293" /LENGTH=78 /DNA_ID=CAMNT_0022289917 /DNA_START=653 /DNA_END=889 /DNA_ORIENTATION=-